MKKWLCIICGLIYSEAGGWPADGIAPGTRWEDVPDDWQCPDCGVGKADFEMIELLDEPEQPVAAVALADKPPIVIIGAGHAGLGLAEALRQRSPEQPVVVVCEDQGARYSKPALSIALAQGKSPAQLVRESALEIEKRLNIRIYAHTQVLSIDTEKQYLETSIGRLDYAKLVLATGAAPIGLPGFAGHPALLSVNDLADYRKFREQLEPTSRVAIIGSGLIGCEFACDLAASGHQVELIGLAQQLLDPLVPAPLAQALEDKLVDQVTCHHGTTLESIEQQEGKWVLTLSSGESCTADIVLSAIGLAARTELAREAGIECQRGIVINAGMKTSAHNVWAIGDCVEINGRPQPYLAPINAAINPLADCLLGRPTMVHYPTVPVVIKTPQLPLVSLPATEGQWQVKEVANGLVAEQRDSTGQLVGFALAGAATAQQQAMLELLNS